MRIECAHTRLVKLSDLRPHPDNLNKHSEAQIRALAKIIAQNGQRSPIVVSNQSGVITKGNGRYEAIKSLEWESCAVDFQNYADELEELRDRVADNEIAKYAEFNKAGFIDQLKELDLDIDEIDCEEFGLLDFIMPPIDPLEDIDTEKIKEDLNKKYILEITFPNEMELADIRDDLISRGYIVREK